MIAAIRSAVFALAFYGGTVPIALVGAALALISRDATVAVGRVWSRWFLACSEVLLGIRLELRGTAPQTGAIVAFKHSSAYETLAVLALFDRPAVVMKAELLRLPVWGFVARRHGSIGVEREKGGVAMRAMLREARLRAEEGRPIILFPEGTRVPPGSAPPLKAGLSALAGALNLPVVPVAHDAGGLWPRAFVKRPGTVTMAFLPPVSPGLSREALDEQVHAAINRDPRQVDLPVTRPARARRVPLWLTLLPLLLFAAGWWWIWDGYRDRLVDEVAALVPPEARLESGGFPYRLEVRLTPLRLDTRDVALSFGLRADAVTLHQVPWKPEVVVANLDMPEARLVAAPLEGVSFQLSAPRAQASLRRDGERLVRLSSVWEEARIATGLLAVPLQARRFEAHLREAPAAGAEPGAGPAGPIRAGLVLRVSGLRAGAGDPLALLLEAEVTAGTRLDSLAAWTADGTVEIRGATLADEHGEVARLEATLVPDGAGGLRLAGTITTVCPASVRAAVAADPPVSELRLRRAVSLPLSGTLPGGLAVPAASPGSPALPVRGQEPPCPRLR
jgi:1-acyl-sn-glycerol-3-phosphate acyltransferase